MKNSSNWKNVGKWRFNIGKSSAFMLFLLDNLMENWKIDSHELLLTHSTFFCARAAPRMWLWINCVAEFRAEKLCRQVRKLKSSINFSQLSTEKKGELKATHTREGSGRVGHTREQQQLDLWEKIVFNLCWFFLCGFSSHTKYLCWGDTKLKFAEALWLRQVSSPHAALEPCAIFPP